MSNQQPIVEIRNVSKEYPVRVGFRDLRGQGGILDWLRGNKPAKLKALDNINLDIYAGETVGIIGRNGSGKSTLLKIISGVTLPTEGYVRVYGRVASLLELGAGFHPLLTGRENIYLNAGLLGMRKAQVDEVIEHIIDFSGIREFIDQPVDTYSSGMYVRLGFAVASFVNPDIFLVDEVLSVGDEEFQRKCRARIGELREQGKTIIFVSHDLGTVNALCNRVFLLDRGKLIDRGSPTLTINFYLRQIGLTEGIHTITDEENQIEAVFNNGKISLFYQKNEITSPMGIETVVLYMNQAHTSPMGKWTITKKGTHHLTATGQLYRLPLTWEINIEIKKNTIFLEPSCKLEKEISIDAIELRIFLPETYTHYIYAGYSEKFAPITPQENNWVMQVPPQVGETTAIFYNEVNERYPSLIVDVYPNDTPLVIIGNTDYQHKSRFVRVHFPIPESNSSFNLDPYKFGKLEITLHAFNDIKAKNKEWFQNWIKKRIIYLKNVNIKIGNGYLEFSCNHDYKSITRVIHFHVQFLISGMWFLSHTLLWESPKIVNNIWIVFGKSARFPFGLRFVIFPDYDNNLFKIIIELLANELLYIDEYNVTIALSLEYEQWKTGFEEGTFPPTSPDQKEYMHLNKSYSTSSYIEAFGKNVPKVKLFSNTEDKFRMSALTPNYSLNARIIQAIASPGQQGIFTFSPGNHIIFDGGVQFDLPK